MIKRFSFIALLWGLAVILYLVYGGKYQRKITTKNFQVFNESKINGIISYVSIRQQGASFRLKGDSAVYVFYPYTGNNKHSFMNFAKRGDKIIKEAYKDTLFLIKEHNIYAYTFRKFSN